MKRVLLPSLFALAACGGTTSSANDSLGSDAGSTEDGASTTPPPPPPALGMRLTSTSVTLDPAGEKYLCWSFPVPAGAPLRVVSTQVTVPRTGVHHYVAFSSPDPVPADAAAWDCSAMKSTWIVVAAGGVGTPGLNMPDGAAFIVPGGSQAILQLHVINPGKSPATIEPVTLDLVGSNAPDLKVAGVLITGSEMIDIPAHATGATVEGGCTLSTTLPNIFAVFPHMHMLGTHVRVSLTKTAGASSTLLDQAWDFGQQGVYPAAASAEAGDRVDVTCTYSNPGSTDVRFGESTHDEMCFGLLYYWPAVKSQTSCLR